MNLKESILKRRSVFPAQFNGKDIDKKDIEELLSMANWAPTHKKTEPWRFKVATGRAKEDLAEFFVRLHKEDTPVEKQSESKEKRARLKVDQSAAVIAICMQRDPKERIPEWEEIAATSMAVQNLWLTVTATGLGGYWSSPKFIDQMHRFFDLAEGERCLGFFFLGQYDDDDLEEGVRGDINDKITWL